jgi:hypothetical protein
MQYKFSFHLFKVFIMYRGGLVSIFLPYYGTGSRSRSTFPFNFTPPGVQNDLPMLLIRDFQEKRLNPCISAINRVKKQNNAKDWRKNITPKGFVPEKTIKFGATIGAITKNGAI